MSPRDFGEQWTAKGDAFTNRVSHRGRSPTACGCGQHPIVTTAERLAEWNHHHGEGPRRVLIVSAGPDVAGGGISLKRAFDAVGGEWQARAVRRKDNWLHYPADITWLKGDAETGAEVADLYRQADIVHIMEKPSAIDLFPLPHDRPVIVQHGGSRYRRDPDGLSAACRAIDAAELAGSFDLMLRPNLGYLPIVADLDAMAALRAKVYRPGRRIRIAHAPTKREIKSTDAIIRAVRLLGQRYPVELDVIERVPWAECLERKARADIFADETTLGYGANAVECFGMGIPVVSGIADPHHRGLMLEHFGALPFVETDEAHLYATIERLVLFEEQRREWGERGRAHAERFHSQPAVVAMATEHYRSAMAMERAA